MEEDSDQTVDFATGPTFNSMKNELLFRQRMAAGFRMNNKILNEANSAEADEWENGFGRSASPATGVQNHTGFVRYRLLQRWIMDSPNEEWPPESPKGQVHPQGLEVDDI